MNNPCYYLNDPQKVKDLWGFKETKLEENKMENYVEIEPNVWKPKDKGDSFEGILIAVKEGTYGKVYCFEWEKKQFVVFGTTVLDDRMNYVNVGERVKVTFKGTVRNKKGQDTKIFSVARYEPKGVND